MLVSAGMSWLMPEYDRTLREQPCQHHQDGVSYHGVQLFREFYGSSLQRVIRSMVFFDFLFAGVGKGTLKVNAIHFSDIL